MYYGTIAMIGITSPGGYYSLFADHYLNYVFALRWFLLHSSELLLNAAGFNVYLKDAYTIKLQNGMGVHIVYTCLGYGVMTFWLAFIFANKGSFIKKVKWMIGGIFIICTVNVLRISLMLVGINQKWPNVFNMDNHTWFNIAAYSVIFIMIYLFDRSQNKELLHDNNTQVNNGTKNIV